MKLVLDANIFISALIGGKAAELLFNPNFDLLTTERTTWEVKKYIPQLAEYSEDTSAHLLFLFELIPVRACQSNEYEKSLSIARSIIGSRDPCDVDILALTLETRVPLWSNDADFENINEITLFKTEDIIELVKLFKVDK